MHKRILIPFFSLTFCLLLSCTNKAPLLSPQDHIKPGTAILWGNINLDLKKMGNTLPFKVHFIFEHHQSKEKIQISKSLKDSNPLIVVALTPGKYFLTDIHFLTSTGDSSTRHSVDWREKKIGFIVKPNHISYFGELSFGISQYKKGSGKNRVRLGFNSNFENDHKVYQRFYGNNPVFQGAHINAENGEKMRLFSATTAQKLSKKTFFIPFKKRHNAIVVTPVINGKYPVEMLVDTGCNGTLFAPHAAEAMGIVPAKDLPAQKVTIADGSVVEIDQVRLQSIALGDLKINNMTAGVCTKCNRSNAVSLLCTDYLNNFHYQIDPQKNLLILKIPE